MIPTQALTLYTYRSGVLVPFSVPCPWQSYLERYQHIFYNIKQDLEETTSSTMTDVATWDQMIL